ncbi:MAG TPA: von Willebrand factor type A domain-containing protein [Saprospiraceae bacterium]|nr:von Willebrand factor type A domain-containing protein [Saprospiraceae bacterium]HPI06856.1 von Willebrand factor type A domain-containing protein [Saprospiraceae bacterium]
MKTFLLMLAGLCVSGFFLVQNNTVLQGTITGADAGEALPGANVSISRDSVFVKGVVADIDGHYTVSIEPGTYDIEVNYTGYEPQKKTGVKVVEGQKNTFDFALKAGLVMSETVVTGYPSPKSYSQNAPVSRSDVRYVPARRKTDFAKMYDKKEVPAEEFERPPHDNSPEHYATIIENQFIKPVTTPVSTFSIDVDCASYANARRFLNEGQLPPRDAVRVEEFINYFDYKYPSPRDGKPFSVYTELAKCPWSTEHQLLSIALQGREIETGQLPPSNFVFLVDVSGSMEDENKLPLVKSSLAMLTDYLRPQDRVALVTYAGAAGLVLPSTPGNQKEKIKAAIEALGAGGSTAGAAGIQLAYNTAQKAFAAGGNNRVVLCTDGDFNVGISSDEDLVKLIEKERESGIYLSILGFGMGNYQDSKMQQLANKGNGNHSYIDQLSEAKKVLISEFGGTLFAIAKDVKIQIEFNADKVAAYRLIGYENRLLAREDFDDDTKDAGEMGAGHRVTALYEIIPAGQDVPVASEKGDLKYEKTKPSAGSKNANLLTLKLRYKQPKAGASSELIETVVPDKVSETMSENLTLAAAAASFGMVLRNSTYKGSATLSSTLLLAQSAAKNDRFGYRTELCRLIGQANAVK